MKSRRVMLMIEIETTYPLKEFKKVGSIEIYIPNRWDRNAMFRVDPIQVQANVVKKGKKP